MGRQEEGGRLRLHSTSRWQSKTTLRICIKISERFFILIMWNNTDTPLAYLITFRSYGTWLHGDERGSIDRFNNSYGGPYLPPNTAWLRHNRKQLKRPPFTLGARARRSVEKAVRETCSIRRWNLQAFNVRTNYVHIVWQPIANRHRY